MTRGLAICAGGLVLAAALAACAPRSSSDAGRKAGRDTVEPAEPSPVIRVGADDSAPGLTFLSWDTEGGDKANTNLLRTISDASAESGTRAASNVGTRNNIKAERSVPRGAGVRVQYLAQGPDGTSWEDAKAVSRRVESGGEVVVFELETGKSRLEWRIECVSAADKKSAANLEGAKSAQVATGNTGDSAALPPGSLRLTFCPMDAESEKNQPAARSEIAKRNNLSSIVTSEDLGSSKQNGSIPVFNHLGGSPAAQMRPAASAGDAPPAGAYSPSVRSAEARGKSKLIPSTLDAAPSLRLVFHFDPKVTSTTVLPGDWLDDGTFRLPAVLNAPDWGPMLLTERIGLARADGSVEVTPGRLIVGRLEGSRAAKTDDLILELPSISANESFSPLPAPQSSPAAALASPRPFPLTITLTPLRLAPPAGLRDASLWPAARRGWLDALQPCARWGEQDKPFSAPPGILGNNVISDPASVSIWFYADQAFFMPEAAPGVSLMPLVRQTIDYWLDRRMRRGPDGRLTGEITGYWDYGGFLDAEASPLIAAWDYVEVTSDLPWLERRIGRLELAADFLASRDIDGDGFVEAVQSGDRGALVQPNRSCAWWDALNCGWKDGYTNALIYRAWRSLADLERELGRSAQAAGYTRLADRLKAVYAKTLYNRQTGWLAWWRSRDGELHDYASPTLNGLAIEYGLVEPGLARRILNRLWKKMAAAGFTRFDLGVPPMLVPVRRSDYLQPDAIGIPAREDGTDTFGQYMNGGITAGQVLHFLDAHYVLGSKELAARADRVLRAMLERQVRGGFQNGVRNATGKGIDWTTWDAKPSGYEGYLADSFRFLQAVLMREPAFRDRLYRPMSGDAGGKAHAAPGATGPADAASTNTTPPNNAPSKTAPASSFASAAIDDPAYPGAALRSDLAYLERATKELLDGCLIKASDGTPLYTPDGQGQYAALWTRDFASMVENAGYLMSKGTIERCIDRLVKGVREDGAVPDRVQADGRPVYTAGPPDAPPAEPNIDNAQFLVFAVTGYLEMTPEDLRGSYYRKWAPALARGMNYIPLSVGGLVWNDPAKPHSPYGFTDTVAKTGELFMESVLYWRAAKMLARWEGLYGSAAARDGWEARARAVEKNIGVLWDDRTGMFFAATRDCRLTDIWGNAYAVANGFPLGERKARILDWLASNYERYVWHGQVRHLPRGEYWERQLMFVEPETYQNGAFWATASGWVMRALDELDPRLARRMFRDLIEDFRAGGVCECVNAGSRKLPSYVNSATNPLGAARRIWRR